MSKIGSKPGRKLTNWEASGYRELRRFATQAAESEDMSLAPRGTFLKRILSSYKGSVDGLELENNKLLSRVTTYFAYRDNPERVEKWMNEILRKDFLALDWDVRKRMPTRLQVERTLKRELNEAEIDFQTDYWEASSIRRCYKKREDYPRQDTTLLRLDLAFGKDNNGAKKRELSNRNRSAAAALVRDVHDTGQLAPTPNPKAKRWKETIVSVKSFPNFRRIREWSKESRERLSAALKKAWEDSRKYNGKYEAPLERWWCDAVKLLGGIQCKLPSMFLVGIPDRIAFMPGGIIVLVEFKRQDGKGKTSNVQKGIHRQLEGLGFKVWIVSTRSEAMEALGIPKDVHEVSA
jgi:hypothetical protein